MRIWNAQWSHSVWVRNRRTIRQNYEEKVHQVLAELVSVGSRGWTLRNLKSDIDEKTMRWQDEKVNRQENASDRVESAEGGETEAGHWETA